MFGISHFSDILPSSEDSVRYAAQALAEVKVADLGTVFALPTTTLGTSAVPAQQVQVVTENRKQKTEELLKIAQVPKRHLPAPLADLVEAQRELAKTAVLRLRGLRRDPFVSG